MAVVQPIVAAPGVVTELRASRSLWSDAWYSFRRDRVSMVASGVLLVLVILSLGAPLFERFVFDFRYDQQDLLHALVKPTLDPPAYLLGSDEIGRSQIVRLLYGGRVSLAVGFFAAVVLLLVGVSVGLVAGYLRGFTDDAVTFSVTVLELHPDAVPAPHRRGAVLARTVDARPDPWAPRLDRNGELRPGPDLCRARA